LTKKVLLKKYLKRQSLLFSDGVTSEYPVELFFNDYQSAVSILAESIRLHNEKLYCPAMFSLYLRLCPGAGMYVESCQKKYFDACRDVALTHLSLKIPVQEAH